jgi:DNA-binding Xre family transcriptional regulator
MKLKLKQKPASTPAEKRIQKIYDRFGGTRDCAKAIGISAQLLSIWKKNGKVPLNRVAEVSKKLKCDPYDLNHEEITELIEAIHR